MWFLTLKDHAERRTVSFTHTIPINSGGKKQSRHFSAFLFITSKNLNVYYNESEAFCKSQRILLSFVH